MASIEVPIHTSHIALASLLKLSGVAGTGGEAKLLVTESLVTLNGRVETRRGAKVRPGDTVELDVEPKVTIVVTTDHEPPHDPD